MDRQNTHHANFRQKLKFDRSTRARANQAGESVWVICRYIPRKVSPNLTRAWRGRQKVVHLLQERFEQLKRPQSIPSRKRRWMGSRVRTKLHGGCKLNECTIGRSIIPPPAPTTS